jgi:hypothetical protein
MLGTQTVRELEGYRVSVALSNGDRLDDCDLVATPRGNTNSLWLFTAGIDLFIPMADVVAVWETGRP